MLLSHDELVELVHGGVIDAPLEHVNGTSVDVRIGSTLLIEREPECVRLPVVDITDKADLRPPMFRRVDMDETGFLLAPGACVLATTVERFRLPPDISCEVKLKSGIARCFMEHVNAGWCDPWWGYEAAEDTRLTMELVNMFKYHWFRVIPGMKVAQMVFFRSVPVPRERGYAVRGQYNGTADATESRGIK